MTRALDRLACALAAVAAACGPAPIAAPPDAFRPCPDASTLEPDAGAEPSPEVPLVPIDGDAYRDWADAWPRLRIGTRTVMRGTYDRTGDLHDSSHFVRGEADDRWIAFESAGPGALVFARANHWHGSPWRYEIDGDDLIVSETSTATPDMPVEGSVWEPAALFPAPLAVTWSITHGADLSWVPIPFERSLEIGYERTHYGTGYFIVQQVPEDAENLSSPIATFARTPPPAEAIDLLTRAGEDLSPCDATPAGGTASVPAAARTLLFEAEGRRVVRAIRLTIPRERAIALGRARLRVTWDDRAAPSIDAPIALFFGAGTLFDRDEREWLVRGLPATIRVTSDRVELAAYWPMPYFRSIRVELEGAGEAIDGVEWEIRTVPFTGRADHVAYFHATYVDHPAPAPMHQDLVFLDTDTVEGGGPWCGTFVGTTFQFSERAVLGTLEGDPRFTFDGMRSPHAHGTGSEEWGGGGDYWGGLTSTLPLAGHPVGAPDRAAPEGSEDAIESAYRFLLADAFPFGRRAEIHLEHGGLNDWPDHYRSVTYWYGAPGACLVATDELDVGDASSEAAHLYVSPDASARYTVTTPWEGAPFAAPASTEDGRSTRGASEMTFAIDPDNEGVLLRRTLDTALFDQRAEVFVADGDDPTPTYEHAGTWHHGGGTRNVRSFAREELGPPEPILIDSGRRLREDELLIAPRHTRGRARIRVRIEYVEDAHAILPRGTPEPSAWTELRYQAFVWQLPAPP